MSQIGPGPRMFPLTVFTGGHFHDRNWLHVVLTASPALGLASQPVSGEEPPPVQKKDILSAQENPQKIGGAFHDFQTANLLLPRDLLAADGKPLHSWRVAILPHLGEEELFKQFKLHEPWDSEHNKKLIPKIPSVYAPVHVKAKEGETFYQVFYRAPASSDRRACR